MYESPLSVITKRMVKEISQSFDDMVLQEVINVGVNVDRAELIKALSYDRDQYNKGYEDGMADERRWISVKDRLPDTMHTMLVCTRNRNNVPKIAMAYYENGFGWCGSGGRWNNVTHWMPLPLPPEGE